ncbi:MAG: hypothetical protein FWF76_05540 [Oscillospiraceae bacterium]|nr:hypothetical protein [Oscillospiraceae bacterium]
MREILLNICLIAVALCLFKMLLPENSMKKQTNFLIALFFLSSMLFFFTSGRIDFVYGIDFSDFVQKEFPYIDFEEELTSAQLRAIKREVITQSNEYLTELLAEHEIFPEEIRVNVFIETNENKTTEASTISDKYSISISEVRLVFSNEEQHFDQLREAINIIQKEVGNEVFVAGYFSQARGNKERS